ncbi:protein of unknown function DUF633 [Alkaliphilus metalliredigens QYMF]|uniref:SAM-dependent methyltransferase n=1 Tax=Alkaliphilus metalliredigens (strain QYMF) TaxID=293826 RepID=A6TSG7_ALKMQ|nr:class I SAM-dependent methyltransferase [Alkaliphilus metalliredigens]ABR49135.1 protein of unknown function DUF633 [Alkaliphilus metalliredigens QYMF]
MTIKLPSRLKKIAQLVPKGSRLADIGTDHGYIPIYLLQNEMTPFVIAGDVNEKPLESAKENIKQYGYEAVAETRLGSGLEVLKPGEVDTVIIAGMGGLLISDILQNDPEVASSIHTFILQPMQTPEVLRRYLVKHGFQIKQDILVQEDHRIYEIILTEKGHQVVADDIQYEIGFFIESNPPEVAMAFIEKKSKQVERIIESLEKSTLEEHVEKVQASQEKLIKLREVHACLKK